jgi:hypothetical protein
MLQDFEDGPVGNSGGVTAFPGHRVKPPRIAEPSLDGRRRFRTIWISDIHLGTKGCNAELLIDFLDATDSCKLPGRSDLRMQIKLLIWNQY